MASAALLTFGTGAGAPGVQVDASFATEDTRSHAEVLAPGVDGLFAHAVAEGPRLDAIVVGVGPGPFTGLRSGIAMARTLAFAWQVPLHGMMSLDALAWDVLQACTPDSDFVIATDARRKEVYWARYSRAGELLDGPHVGPAGDVPAVPVYGMGASLYRDVFEASGATVDPAFEQSQPVAFSLGQMAARRIAAGSPLLRTAPLYLRESDAKVPGPRKRAL